LADTNKAKLDINPDDGAALERNRCEQLLAFLTVNFTH